MQFRSLGGILLLAAGLFTACKKSSSANGGLSSPDTGLVTDPDHIILVWMENKGFDRIIGSANAPFINSLVSQGTLFTNSFALTHPSYPNYIRFFSGQPNRINSNNCIDGTPLFSENLYTILKKKGKTFAWYSEDLPLTGSRICASGNYVEKHNPVTIFSNVPDSINKPLSLFPTDFHQLENVVCITPNLQNDMHDGSIQQGDNWLKQHFEALINWCKTNNSIFIVYWDESETDADNRIPVIATGEKVKPGFTSTIRYDHYSWTKTICLMFDAEADWTTNLKKARRVSDAWK
jgi:phosphatidylinositol-3-phosphatase